MALRAIMLRREIERREAELNALREQDEAFQTREANLETAIAEVETDEQRDAMNAEIDTFENERSAHAAAVAAAEAAVEQLRTDLAAEEARQNTNPPAAPAVPAENQRRENTIMNMNTRAIIFRDMSIEQREALVARQDVSEFLTRVREGIAQKRALPQVGLTIPEVMMPMLRQAIIENSATYKHVNVVSLKGEGRQVIMGDYPEAVWTDCCAQLNELSLSFYGLELDCNKVGGFFAICNATLADSDLNLLAEVITALGKAIGRAIDRADIYGTGTKMPLGVVTRLAQQSQPASYPTAGRPWVDLHSSNIRTINGAGMTGVELFAALAGAIGYAKHKYTTGGLTWFMNETTWMTIVAKAMSINAAGNLVTAVGRVMPVLGGDIEILDFMADNDIVAGYFDLYTLGEREGVEIASSDQVRFIQDQTVVKGTARYDGAPVIAEAFVAINIGNSTPATSSTFPADGANTVSGILLPATATVASGATLALQAVLLPLGVEAPVTWTSATTGKATISDAGVVTGVSSGSSVITAAAGGKSATCTVTVTSA